MVRGMLGSDCQSVEFENDERHDRKIRKAKEEGKKEKRVREGKGSRKEERRDRESWVRCVVCVSIESSGIQHYFYRVARGIGG